MAQVGWIGLLIARTALVFALVSSALLMLVELTDPVIIALGGRGSSARWRRSARWSRARDGRERSSPWGLSARR